MLNVPAPTLPGSTAILEKPFVASLAAPNYSDGSTASASEVTALGALIFRGAPGSAEVWDDAQKSWRAALSDNDLIQLKPVAGVVKDGNPPWQATLVGVGQKDSAGNGVYAAASGGTPTYFMRAVAKATRAGAADSGLSPPSPSFTFTSSSANARFSASFDTPDTQPDAAHKVRMALKSDAMQPVGYIEIRSLPSFEVEIANCDASGNALAKILLQASGEIHLTPASGQRVVIESDIETNRILYSPAGGGSKVWLA
jgi:hypothetical protein